MEQAQLITKEGCREYVLKKHKKIISIYFYEEDAVNDIKLVDLFMSKLKDYEYVSNTQNEVHWISFFGFKISKDIIGLQIGTPQIPSFLFQYSSLLKFEIALNLKELSKEELFSLIKVFKNANKPSKKKHLNYYNKHLNRIIKMYKKRLGAAAELADIFGDVEV